MNGKRNREDVVAEAVKSLPPWGRPKTAKEFFGGKTFWEKEDSDSDDLVAAKGAWLTPTAGRTLIARPATPKPQAPPKPPPLSADYFGPTATPMPSTLPTSMQERLRQAFAPQYPGRLSPAGQFQQSMMPRETAAPPIEGPQMVVPERPANLPDEAYATPSTRDNMFTFLGEPTSMDYETEQPVTDAELQQEAWRNALARQRARQRRNNFSRILRMYRANRIPITPELVASAMQMSPYWSGRGAETMPAMAYAQAFPGMGQAPYQTLMSTYGTMANAMSQLLGQGYAAAGQHAPVEEAIPREAAQAMPQYTDAYSEAVGPVAEAAKNQELGVMAQDLGEGDVNRRIADVIGQLQAWAAQDPTNRMPILASALESLRRGGR